MANKETHARAPAPDMAAQLRAAIVASGKSQYQLAKETGISQGRIGDFLRGGDIRLATAGPLAAAVGLGLARLHKSAKT